jgi:Domain of unknown function (DUF4332)/Zinc dependent phospholipase C
MTLLERVVRTYRCRSTHHFIAFDALSRLTGPDAENWKRLMLVHHEHLLVGAKAPDATFKDFKNHVCHITEGLWGGAPGKAMEWYAISVEKLRAKKWSEAAYALGVLSHYYADPLMPFHTAQTEEEGIIHRAVEWSIAKSRPEIDAIIAIAGYPDITMPEGPGFVADMVLDGAAMANAHYQMFIDHYNIDIGAKDPRAGLDDEMRAAIAVLIAYATAGFAAIVSRAVAEARVAPPKVHLTVQGYIETLDIPLRMLVAKLEDIDDRRAVSAMYKEYQATGKVIRTLPEDDKLVRRMHAREVRRMPMKELDALPAARTGRLHGTAADAAEAPDALTDIATAPEMVAAPTAVVAEIRAATEKPAPARLPAALPMPAPEAADTELFEPEPPRAPVPEAVVAAPARPASVPGPRALLTRYDALVEAPSIGRKTAAKLAREGLRTVADLLDCDAEETAYLLDISYIDADTLTAWQDQARLMLDVPGLRAHDVQVLVGAGIRNKAGLSATPARTLFRLATDFLRTPEGERVQPGGAFLAESEVAGWIERAREAA